MQRDYKQYEVAKTGKCRMRVAEIRVGGSISFQLIGKGEVR